MSRLCGKTTVTTKGERLQDLRCSALPKILACVNGKPSDSRGEVHFDLIGLLEGRERILILLEEPGRWMMVCYQGFRAVETQS